MADTARISRAQMKDAIKRSGYLMEQRVFPVLEQAGYYVETNPVYPDPISGKSREYDFSAITAKKLFRENYDFLFTQLIGECINNIQPLAFFKTESPIDFLFYEDIKCAGIPLYFPDDTDEKDDISFQEFFHLDKFHHYCNGTYSTQYCSFKKRSGKDAEWMAWHDDEHHGVFNSIVEATKFSLQECFSDWVPPKKDEEEPVNLNLFYPLLIVRADLYECSQSEERFSLRKREHIQFRKSAISSGKSETYHIDIIVESYLKKYLDMLEKEQEILKRRFRRRKKDILRAIDHIVYKAKKAK